MTPDHHAFVCGPALVGVEPPHTAGAHASLLNALQPQRRPVGWWRPDVLDRNGSQEIGYAESMGELDRVARRYLLDRAIRGRRIQRRHVRTRRHLHGPRPRGRFGFWGPVPYYTTRTRRGSEVSAGGCGCCLPIPLIGALGAIGALRVLWRRSAEQLPRWVRGLRALQARPTDWLDVRS